MSDIDESRPLTRRELRMRAMAAQGVTPGEQPEPDTRDLDVSDSLVISHDGQGPTDSLTIEIPLFDEKGRLRSRRELRELREQAEAEAAQAAAEAEAEAETEVAAEAAVKTEILDDAADEPEGVDSADETNGSATSSASDSAEGDSALESQAEGQTLSEQLGGYLTPTEPIDVITGEIEIEHVEESNAADDAESVESTEIFEEAEVEHDHDEVDAAETQAYSFPDIAPLDEAQSVFDDPASRVMGSGAPSEARGDDGFDALITRAVAQEGAASSSNTSALILPAMPDTDRLSGPIGETGEILFTGSISLPQSLGETGSHSALHDLAEHVHDPLDELGLSEATIPANGHMAPVSAVRAVSAQAGTGAMVSEAVKDKSKMPVVLISVGGALVVVAAGLIVWAAVSGLFG